MKCTLNLSHRKTSWNVWFYCSFLLLLPSMLAFGQEGKRNLLFNSASDIIRLDGFTETPNTTGIANTVPAEGIAHAEDQFGNILFMVTSGGVYNTFNSLMPGSLGMYANASAAEINIAPVPGNPNQHYILYVRNESGCSSFGGNPLHYSIVDMSLNGGLGDVISLNTLLDPGIFGEGMEVVRVPNSKNYWFLVYECDTGFKRFLIDETGISEGEIMLSYPQPDGTDGRGELDFHKGKIGACFAWSSRVFLADFDPETGELSNPINIDDPAFDNSPFGVEFSPSGNKMYITLWYSGGQPNIFQYDIPTGILSAVYSSAIDLGQIEQKGDKLYVIQDLGSEIIVIDNSDDDIPVFSTIGLPGITGLGISDYNIQAECGSGFTLLQEAHCLPFGEVFTLSPADTSVDYEWTDSADPTGTVLQVSPTFDLTIGADLVMMNATSIPEDSCATTTIINYVLIPKPDVDAGEDVTIEAGQSVQLQANSSFPAEFTWLPTAYLDDPLIANPVATPPETTTYYVSASHGSCFAFDTIVVEVSGGVGIDNAAAAGLKWYPNPVKNTLTITAPQVIESLQVHNIVGREVLKMEQVQQINIAIPMRDWQTGVYFVTAVVAGKSVIMKVVKE